MRLWVERPSLNLHLNTEMLVEEEPEDPIHLNPHPNPETPVDSVEEEPEGPIQLNPEMTVEDPLSRPDVAVTNPNHNNGISLHFISKCNS